MKKSVAIYCRVARGGSTEFLRFELDSQRDILSDYAARHGWTVSEVYEDAGFSGRTTDRPGLQDLLAAEHVDTVLVVNRSRLFRGTAAEEPQWPFEVVSLNELF